MAAPLPQEDREKILGYLKLQDLSELTGNQIKELIKTNLGISVSKPTASKFKAELMDDSPDDSQFARDDLPLGSLGSPEESSVIKEAPEAIKPGKPRSLSQEQISAIEQLLQGKSDKVIAETVGVSRETISAWRKQDLLFITEVNRRRVELWNEACVRMKSLANRALDVLELQLSSDDPRTSLAAAKYVLQGTKLLGDINLQISGPTDPKEVILEKARKEARNEFAPRLKEINDDRHQMFDLGFDVYETETKAKRIEIEEEIEALAQRKLKKVMVEEGLMMLEP